MADPVAGAGLSFVHPPIASAPPAPRIGGPPDPSTGALVEGDPTRDISAVRKVRMVVKDGAISYPEDIYRALGIRPFAAKPKVIAPAGDAG